MMHIPRDLVHLDLAPRYPTDHRGVAGQVRNVAGEPARAMNRDRLRDVAGVIDDLDLARLDDMEFEVSLADREERFSIPVRFHRGRRTPAQFGDLGFVQGREGNRLKIMLGHSYSTSENGNPLAL
jgi:hypothetical protein